MIVSEADTCQVSLSLCFSIVNNYLLIVLKNFKNLETQFRRVLDQIMKIALSDDEINALADKYGAPQRNNLNNINYKQFCNAISRGNLLFHNYYKSYKYD